MLILDKLDQDRIILTVHKNAPVLICSRDIEDTEVLTQLTKQAGGRPLSVLQNRWKDLYREAFFSRVSVVMGDARVILGLAKLLRIYGVSLKIKDAVITSSCGDWMESDIAAGLDCRVHKVCSPEDTREEMLVWLERELLRWTSILDCRVEKTAAGLELELVVFPGERLPKLPSCARLVVRNWDPDRDVPFALQKG